ncbi:MAG: tetratricopeptide repeat protein [Candidatus Saganbacteria bacterium]|nr:tetratricopeptide repeat protein [Candidatus Saganbacteria bacterium]
MDNLEKIQNQLKSRPYDPVLLMSLGRILIGRGEFKAAKNEYRLAVLYNPHIESEVLLDFESQIKEKPGQNGLCMALAEFLLSLGSVDLAVLELEELLENVPQLSEVYNLLGRLYIKLDRIDDAIILLEKALELKLRDVFLVELLAGAYVEKGRLEEAVDLYEEVLSETQGNKRILRTLGELYTRLSKFERAADHYHTMLTDDSQVVSEVIQHLEELLRKCGESVYIREILGDVYLRAVKPDEAVKLYREIVVLERGRRDEIIAKYRRILKTYPEHFNASVGLAEALTVKGEFSEAVKIYESLLKKHPEETDLLVDELKMVLEACPDQVLAHHALAEAYFIKGLLQEGTAELACALALDSELADQVIKKCREVLKTYPHLLNVKVVLGQAYLRKGEAKEAINIAQETQVLEPQFAAASVLLGDAYSFLGETQPAEEAFLSALKSTPYDLKIQAKYKGLKEKEIEKEIQGLKNRIIGDEWRISLHLDLGKHLFTLGKIEDAVEELQLAAKDHSRSAFAYNLLGLCFKENGQFHIALEQFKKALENLPPELREFGKIAQLNMGGAYEALGLLMKAVSTYEGVMGEDVRFVSLKEKIRDLKTSKLSTLRSRCLVCILSNLQDKKIIAFWGRRTRVNSLKKEEELSISFGQEHNNNGFDLFMKGMYEGAKEEFSLAVQLDAGFATALNNLGVVYLLEGKTEDAHVCFTGAREKEADVVIALNNIGVAHLIKGDYEKALKNLEAARKLAGPNSALSINLGDTYFLLGRVEEAFKAYKEVPDLDVLSDFVSRRLMFRTPQGPIHVPQ